ncbi:MAG TPA: enoyl-CoA hydratase-related protein, partial [Burkholderiales bacterium]
MKKLVDIVGAAYAKEIMITARQFSAAEAKEMGLVHRVVPVAELEKLTREYCEAIAANAPLTMRAAKRIIGEVGKTQHDEAMCNTLVKECFDSADYKEGRKAFMEKRKPVFKGS